MMHSLKVISPVRILFVCVFLIAISPGCKQDKDQEEQEEVLQVEPNIVEVLTTAMEFQAPDAFPSGWTTIRYTNNSSMVHFALLQRFPDGHDLADHQDTIAPLFQNIMDQVNGRSMSAPEIGTNPPAWMSEIVYFGGTGLVSPGQKAEVTEYLIPGTYVLECYVKTNEIFHSYNPDPEIYGMVHQFTVTEELSELQEPEPTARVSISTENGLQVEGDISPGENILRVLFADQKVYANFIQHDLHIIRREPGADMDSLLNWINWMTPGGLSTVPPSGFTFVGGIHEMPAGSTGYCSFVAEPGEYLFMSEVPRPDTLGLLKVVTVAGQ